jgi:hypothetical protein
VRTPLAACCAPARLVASSACSHDDVATQHTGQSSATASLFPALFLRALSPRAKGGWLEKKLTMTRIRTCPTAGARPCGARIEAHARKFVPLDSPFSANACCAPRPGSSSSSEKGGPCRVVLAIGTGSHARHRQKRDAIRETWLARLYDSNLGPFFRHRFIVGWTKDASCMRCWRRRGARATCSP